ncbi:MAG: hypothetical protein IKW45_01580 [Clostridia bacterium]|nr:hypothetical protein [Clostridia bacterium]
MAEKKKSTTKKPIAKKNVPKKKRRKFSISLKNAKTLKLLAIIFVVLLLVIIAAAQFGGVTFSTISDRVRTSLAGIGSGEGYPYNMNGIEISNAGITNSELVLVQDDTVKVLDSTAKELSNITHKYDHPVMNSNSGRILLYDEGGTEFRVQSKTRILYEKELKNIIFTGAMGKNGSVAIASSASGAESMLTVYDDKEDEIFVWKCAKEHIVSCDVSDNGKLFAVSVMNVDNGSVYSKVYIFDKNKTEPKASFEYKDSAISSVQFLSNETLFVLGNNVCEIIKGDEVKEKIDVSVNTPSRLYISDNNTAVLVLSKYSSTTKKIIKVYNKSGKELFTQEIDGLVKSVSTDGRYIAVLTDDNVQIYNTKGEMVGSADVNTDAEEVIVSSRNTYVYSLDKIQKYSSVGDNTEEKK